MGILIYSCLLLDSKCTSVHKRMVNLWLLTNSGVWTTEQRITPWQELGPHSGLSNASLDIAGSALKTAETGQRHFEECPRGLNRESKGWISGLSKSQLYLCKGEKKLKPVFRNFLWLYHTAYTFKAEKEKKSPEAIPTSDITIICIFHKQDPDYLSLVLSTQHQTLALVHDSCSINIWMDGWMDQVPYSSKLFLNLK